MLLKVLDKSSLQKTSNDAYNFQLVSATPRKVALNPKKSFLQISYPVAIPSDSHALFTLIEEIIKYSSYVYVFNSGNHHNVQILHGSTLHLTSHLK